MDERVDYGYLKRTVDPDERRARLIIPTSKGIRGAGDGLAALDVAQSELLAHLGPRKVALLSRTLNQMLRAFGASGA